MADILFSVNAVLPVFLVLLVGYVLKLRGFIDEHFVDTAIKITFRVALPCMLFKNITAGSLTEAFDLNVTLLAVIGTLVIVVLLRLLVPRFLKQPPTYAAFIQAAFRSNFLLLGMPLAYNIAGQAALSKASATLTLMIPLYNVLAVLVLGESDKAEHQGEHRLLRRIATNPLIIAGLVAVIFSLLQLTLPPVLDKPIGYLADMAMPLALFTLGGSIDLKADRARIRPALAATAIKLVLTPVLALLVGYYLGMRDAQLTVILVLFAGPSAVSCFPMAHQMGADSHLTALIVVFTTGFAAITLFFFVYVTRVLGLIG